MTIGGTEELNISAILQGLNQVFTYWQETGEITEEAIGFFSRPDTWEVYVSEIQRLVADNEPPQALGILMLHVAFINRLLGKRPSLIGFLTGQINKFKDTLARLGQKFDADNFGISVSGPLGISVSLGLGWNLHPHVMARDPNTWPQNQT